MGRWKGIRSSSRRIQRPVGEAYSANLRTVYFPFERPLFAMEGSMEFESEFEQNLFELRKEKLKEIEKLGQVAYPNRFPARQDQSAITLAEVRAKWDAATA